MSSSLILSLRELSRLRRHDNCLEDRNYYLVRYSDRDFVSRPRYSPIIAALFYNYYLLTDGNCLHRSKCVSGVQRDYWTLSVLLQCSFIFDIETDVVWCHNSTLRPLKLAFSCCPHNLYFFQKLYYLCRQLLDRVGTHSLTMRT